MSQGQSLGHGSDGERQSRHVTGSPADTALQHLRGADTCPGDSPSDAAPMDMPQLDDAWPRPGAAPRFTNVAAKVQVPARNRVTAAAAAAAIAAAGVTVTTAAARETKPAA